MQPAPAGTLRLTHALLRPETSTAAAEALRDRLDRVAVEGLVTLLHQPRTARDAITAIAVLEASTEPIVLDALTAALESPHASVRLVAVQSIQRRHIFSRPHDLARRLGLDESWMVRRAALDTLAEHPAPERWLILEAATDPHWRVRHALIRVLWRWGEDAETRAQILADVRLRDNVRAQATAAYLRHCWYREFEPPQPIEPSWQVPLGSAGPDPDPAVYARNLERLGEDGRRELIELMPYALGHTDERVRGWALETLRKHGDADRLVRSLRNLDDPRAGVGEMTVKLFASLDLDRREEVVRAVFRRAEASPGQLAWAIDQVGEAVMWEEEEERLLRLFGARNASEATPSPPAPLPLKAGGEGGRARQPVVVRCALARLAGRADHPDAERWLRYFFDDPHADVQLAAVEALGKRSIDPEQLAPLFRSPDARLRAAAVRVARPHEIEPLLHDPDARVRLALAESRLASLQQDPHPLVRAAALTPALARELIANPARETSWHVLAKAARLAKVPFWKLEPAEPWRPVETLAVPAEPIEPRFAPPPHARVLGPEKWVVAPMGISGHYGLPVEGFVRAVEHGVNLVFWEPNYRTLTDFFTRISPADRARMHVVAGTFEADGDRVRRDVERVLRMLQIDRVSLFLIFWTQNWKRISPDVLETLDQLKAEGKIAVYSLSTHNRTLAVEAMDRGWDPVMVRHSAAHRGAEERIFPRAAELGTSLITFNNTCYGRLLEPMGDDPPRASDCYRFTLAQPGVRCCLSAPATLEELEENLTVLTNPELPAERRQRLEAHGARLYREEKVFQQLVRSR